MVIIIVSSVLRSITDGLENKSVSQITYYITYILIVTIVMKNFSDIINMVKASIDNLVAFTNCLIPLLITLMITTGNIASAGMLQPIMLWIISFIVFIHLYTRIAIFSYSVPNFLIDIGFNNLY